MQALWILVSILVIILWVLIAIKFRDIAKEKGSNDNYFWWCFLFGIIGWLMVISLPDKRLNKQNQEIIALLKSEYKYNDSPTKNLQNASPAINNVTTWTCKKCGASNKQTNLVCKDCGEYK